MLEGWRFRMKHEISSALLLVCLQASGNGQPATSFFPFHVGDLWQSRYAAGPLAFTDRMDSIDSDIDSIIYVRFQRIDHDARDTSLLWYVIEDSNLVYEDALPRQPTIFTRLLYKLDASVGQTWTVRVFDFDTTYREVAKVAAMDTGSIFGRHILFKDIVYGMTRTTVTDTGWGWDTVTIANDFGVIYRYVEPRGPIFLSGAIINNVRWGYIVSVLEAPIVLSQFFLNQNLPNPFNPSTTILFSISKPTWVKLEVYDALGRHVLILVDRVLEAGRHSVVWNASGYSSGVYLYRLQTPEGTATKKMILQK